MFWSSSIALAIGSLICLTGCGSHSPNPPARGTTLGQHQHQHSYAGATPPEGQRGAQTSDDDDEPNAARSQVSAARPAARAFFHTYIAFLYGRLPASRIADDDPGLRSQLEDGRARTTPAERASRPRIAHLALSSSGPPISVIALAVITGSCCGPSTLTATLETRHGRWLVVAVSG